MNKQAIQGIIKKDLTVVLRSKAVLLPLILVPIIMLIVLPIAAGIGVFYIPENSSEIDDLHHLLDRLPQLRTALEDYSTKPKILILILVYFSVPLYLILPLMTSSVLAADSFAGEKERKTLEALLHSPTTDRELFLAKVLASWLPASLLSLVGGLLYSLVANLAAWPILHEIILPNPMWVVLILWVAPAVSALGLCATVLVSARVNSFQEAYQIGGILVIPFVALLISQAAGLIYFNVAFVFLLGALIWIINSFLILLAFQWFSRSALLSKL